MERGGREEGGGGAEGVEWSSSAVQRYREVTSCSLEPAEGNRFRSPIPPFPYCHTISEGISEL